jgi:hypothetical protein
VTSNCDCTALFVLLDSYTDLAADSVIKGLDITGLGFPKFGLNGFTPSHGRCAHTMPTWEIYLQEQHDDNNRNRRATPAAAAG